MSGSTRNEQSPGESLPVVERWLLDGLLGGITSHVLIAVLVFMFAATDPWYTPPRPFNSHYIIMGMSQLFSSETII